MSVSAPAITKCRGLRGAITVTENSEGAILEATRELLSGLFASNGLVADDLAAILFTATADLDAAFPAKAAREMGYLQVPLMCSQEMAVPGSPKGCIRVMLLVNTAKRQEELIHVYLRGAVVLRPEFRGTAPP